jgi:hypothetical protein
VYPQQCDLSPDGRYLCYSAYKGNARWAPGQRYLAVSRLPWLTALAAWPGGGAAHFVDEVGRCDMGRPDVGNAAELHRRIGLARSSSTGPFAGSPTRLA